MVFCFGRVLSSKTVKKRERRERRKRDSHTDEEVEGEKIHFYLRLANRSESEIYATSALDDDQTGAAMRASPLSSRGLAVSMSFQGARIVARAPGMARRRQPHRRPIDVVTAAAAASSPDPTPSSSSSKDFTRASYVPPQKYNANGDDGSVALPTRLSGTPMSREARRWFYDDAAESVDALLEAGLAKRLSVKLTIPETNPEQDTFRIGTLLELVRAIAVKRAKGRGERVRVVVSFCFFFFFFFCVFAFFLFLSLNSHSRSASSFFLLS